MKSLRVNLQSPSLKHILILVNHQINQTISRSFRSSTLSLATTTDQNLLVATSVYQINMYLQSFKLVLSPYIKLLLLVSGGQRREKTSIRVSVAKLCEYLNCGSILITLIAITYSTHLLTYLSRLIITVVQAINDSLRELIL